jgi:hypothetical protein
VPATEIPAAHQPAETPAHSSLTSRLLTVAAVVVLNGLSLVLIFIAFFVFGS